MRDVNSWFKITAISLCCLLASCKSPDVEVTSIDKKLPAPSLKSGTQSPFDQDMDAQSYVRIQGTCDKRVGDLSLSFDNVFWSLPPVIPDTTNSTLPSGTTNDFNCADGEFDFYLTKADVITYWGVDASSGTKNIDNIYIKGETLIGETFKLVLHDNKSGSGSEVATTIDIQKRNPVGYAGSGQCAEFWVNVKSSQGNFSSYTTDITLGISKTVDGTTSSDISFYEDYPSCYSNATAQLSTLTIKKGQNMKAFYYKMPSDTPSVGKTFDFKVLHPTALTASTVPASVILRSSSSNYHWMEISSMNYRLYKNTCTPFNLLISRYDGTAATDRSNSLDGVISSADTHVKFYTDETCATSLAKLSVAANINNKNFYVRYETSGTSTQDIVNFSIAAQASLPGDTSYIVDPTTYSTSVDVSAKNTVTAVDIDTFNLRSGTNTDICQSVYMNYVNGNHTPIASTGVAVGVAFAGTGVGNFYTDGSCSTQRSTLTTTGAINAQLYFKLSPSTAATTYQMMFTVAGVTKTTEAFPLVKAPSTIKITGPNPMNIGACQPMLLSLTDSANNIYSAAATMGFYITDTHTGNVYTDSGCTNQTNLITLDQNTSATTFYYKPVGFTNGESIDLTPSVQSGGPSYTLAAVGFTATAQGCVPGSINFASAGTYNYSVTAAQAALCTFTITVRAGGGASVAGGGAGGLGGSSNFSFTPSSAGDFYISVGDAGSLAGLASMGGGGAGGGTVTRGGGGGGASSVRFVTSAPSDTLLAITGGGGGGGPNSTLNTGGDGGSIGTGANGATSGSTEFGRGGSNNLGGAAGSGTYQNGGAGGSSIADGFLGGGSGGGLAGISIPLFSISGGGGGAAGLSLSGAGGGGGGYGGGGGGSTGSTTLSGGGGGGGFINTGVISTFNSVTGNPADTSGAVLMQWN
jgi:hypothetical protein